MPAMQLLSPSEIAVNNVSDQLIGDVEKVARVVQELRPLTKPVVRRIEEELLGERVYSSNAIEGSTLDLRETVLILKGGGLGAKKKREATEARNLGTAARTIAEWVDKGEALYTIDKLLGTHRIILTGIEDNVAGVFRNQQVFIAPAKHQPPDESRVPNLMQQVMEMLQQTVERRDARNGILTAVWAHWAIARVHPFFDGNGRMARLWQDYVLYKHRLTCAILPPEQRRTYLNALSEADEGDFNPLIQLVAQRLSYSLDRYLAVIKADEKDAAFLQELAGKADARVEEKRKLAYMRWSRRMLLLRDAFELSTARLSEASARIQVQVRPYDLIDQTRWENILSGVGAERTWFFLVDATARAERRWPRRRYFFYFGKHFWRDGLDTDQDRSEQRVSLLISEDDDTGHGVALDMIPGSPIRLREVFAVEDEYVCRLFDPSTGNEHYLRNLTATQIAQEFLRDVILNRLT